MNRSNSCNCRRERRSTGLPAFGLLSLLAACGGPGAGAEEQLRQWVDAGEAAAEARDRRALLSLLSPSYSDARANDRDDIGDLLRVYFLRQNSVELIVSIDEIRVIGGSAAEIDLDVGMAGTNDGVFGFSADAYRFELELERDGDDWLLISARWGELGGELH